jgi:hypothetical protein
MDPRILIIDDDKEQLQAVIETFHKVSGLDYELIIGERGTNETFFLDYFLSGSTTMQEHLRAIKEIVVQKKINVLWIGKNYKKAGSQDILKILDDAEIIKNLTSRDFNITVYFLDEDLQNWTLDEMKRESALSIMKSQEVHPQKEFFSPIIDKIFYLECSPSFFLSDEKYATDPTPVRIRLYGMFIANVLNDLKNKYLIEKSRRSKFAFKEEYNYFRETSFNFLPFFKMLRGMKKEEGGYQLGQLSFSIEKEQTKEVFLLDVPYKEYYEKYDAFVENENLLMQLKSDTADGFKCTAFNYAFDDDGVFSVQHNIFSVPGSIEYMVESDPYEKNQVPYDEEKLKRFLNLLHTAIFYEPEKYSNPVFPGGDFDKQDHSGNNKKRISLLFFSKKEDLSKIPGDFHFSLWRYTTENIPVQSIDEVKQRFHENYEIIKAKAEESLLPMFIADRDKAFLQALVAQIFARNFAHNIGSHVAIRSSNTEVRKRLLSMKLVNQAEDIIDMSINDWLDLVTEKINLYEINRNAFLAEYNSPPQNLMFFREIILPFCENTLLLDNIAQSENIKYEEPGYFNKLKINVIVNGTPMRATYPYLRPVRSCQVAYPDNFPYFFESIEDFRLVDAFNQVVIENSGIDVEVCMPNPHAFYSILENFIRNSAKHNKNRLVKYDKNLHSELLAMYPDFSDETSGYLFPGRLEIFLEIRDDGDPDYFYVSIFDNISLLTERRLEIFQRGIKIDRISEGKEIKRNLGIADIKINAHLIASREEFSEQNLSESIELLVGREPASDNSSFMSYDEFKRSVSLAKYSHYRFGYRFKLTKAKKVAWIGKEFISPEMMNAGFIAYPDLISFASKGNNLLTAFDFAVLEIPAIDQLDDGDDIENLLTHLPFRILINGNANEIRNKIVTRLITERKICCVPDRSLSETNPGMFLKKCWEMWLTRWGIDKDKKVALIISQELKPVWLEDFSNEKNIVRNDVFNVYYTTLEDCPGNLDFIEKEEYRQSSQILFFDQHGNGFQRVLGNDLSKLRFYTVLEKGHPDQALIQDKHHAEFDASFFFRLIESCLLKILVIDERLIEPALEVPDSTPGISMGFVAKFYDQKVNADFLLGKRTYLTHAMNNIFYATNFLDAEVEKSDTLSGTAQIDRVENKLYLTYSDLFRSKGRVQELKSERITDFDFIIVHRTYLDEKYFENWKKKDVFTALKKSCVNLLIVSGGGRPHSIHDLKYKFLAFSRIASSFGSHISKYSLIRNLQINETAHHSD